LHYCGNDAGVPLTEGEIRRIRQLDHLEDIHGYTIRGPLAKAWARHRSDHRRRRADHWHPKRARIAEALAAAS
jgi:hypothetical protein